MIWFWIVAGLLILAALAALLGPLVWRAGRVADEGEAAVSMLRRQLADIDTEQAQGRLTSDEAAAARTETTRRMLAAADREREGGGLAAANSAEASWRVGAAVSVAGLLPAAAIAIYFAVGAPAAINPPPAASTDRGAGQHDVTELVAAANQLKARLARDPDHPEGWVLLGRTLASLQRFDEARDAYLHAIAFKPDELQLHAELGEVLVLAAGGTVTSAAEAEFAKSGNDPRARFYGAEAAAQRGDSAAAKTAFQALLADAPADAPWRKIVAARLAEIAPDEPQAEHDGSCRPERTRHRSRPIDVAGRAPSDDSRHGGAPRRAARAATRRQGRMGSPCPCLRCARRRRKGASGARQSRSGGRGGGITVDPLNRKQIAEAKSEISARHRPDFTLPPERAGEERLAMSLPPGLCLVTGATGFVGSAVVRALLGAGHDVRVLARPNSDRRNLVGSCR